jgi:hypothetical protein
MKQYSISLRIWHPTLSGDQISLGIGRVPEVSQSVGEQRTTPKGNLIGRINEETYCVFRLVNRSDGFFTDGLAELLSGIAQISPYLQSLRDSGGATEIYVWIFPEGEENLGFILEFDLMRELVAHGLRLSVELYAP